VGAPLFLLTAFFAFFLLLAKVDAKEPVLDVKFAPHHMGLKLALCSKDGYVRIYEAKDVMQPDHWEPVHEFEAGGEARMAVTCLSWNPSRFDTPMLLLGCAPAEGATAGTATTVKVWSFNEDHRRWQVLPWGILEGPGAPHQVIHDVDWAPNLGRKYHLLAACSGDEQNLRIWRIPNGERFLKARDDDDERVCHELQNTGQARRVRWNVTGTILASSGDDGEVQLWTMDHFSRKWSSNHKISSHVTA